MDANGFVKLPSGLLVPPDSSSTHVEKAVFAVVVKGFTPIEDKRVYRGGDHRRKRMVAFAEDK